MRHPDGCDHLGDGSGNHGVGHDLLDLDQVRSLVTRKLRT